MSMAAADSNSLKMLPSMSGCWTTLEMSGWSAGIAIARYRSSPAVQPGSIITLRFAIWDSGDGILDSLALIDNFRWSEDVPEILAMADEHPHVIDPGGENYLRQEGRGLAAGNGLAQQQIALLAPLGKRVLADRGGGGIGCGFSG